MLRNAEVRFSGSKETPESKASDVISYTIDAIVDDLDPNISSNNIVISGVTFFVTVPGTYFITYTIVDVHGSYNSYNKTMIVVA